MLRITIHNQQSDCVLQLEGHLVEPWVTEVTAVWREVSQGADGRRLIVDLRGVCHVDAAGKDAMSVMYLAGARLVACGCVMPEVIREISQQVRRTPHEPEVFPCPDPRILPPS